ncbi:uroporphyrinogen-III C-methyltransferase [Secundilactobacillus silagei]|uniref:Uroporphyrinogen-III C-methyltransferase n=1 Tax=Secundilactobacillus silagei JCM 19001 TaxID=1302250 RepID=A0A1Z5IFM8_9LACO|nr:uroporphyrinogen-III C-methyltransferase [Secundilactobacillus silagei]TDG72076.1 hypothetical protein C5L25_002460 [Secundilactobacillus silagei JCM 19001]GAX00486.1 uroporphyrinogen-III C-methyltransferase [Secundilactobacillus silagei JCM 19001]
MSGFVSLVGAGPGDPELLTVLGRRRLLEADVIVYDRLVNPSLFMMSSADKVDVGKMPNHHKFSQYKINELLVELATQGKRVVRLKAGDPYVFGRGGEEAQYLCAHHIDYEVVPGITSAIAGLAAAGIPITHRDMASSFHIITGHRKANGRQLDWANVAQQEGTLVFLMGMKQLPVIVDELVKNGRPADSAVAIVQWATRWQQRTVTGNLSNIVEIANQAQIGAPALIVVGEVVKLRDELNVHLPLAGKHILIPFKVNSKLSELLKDQGASVDYFERSTKQPLPFDIPDLDKPETLVIEDAEAFKVFLDVLLTHNIDTRRLSKWRLLVTNTVAQSRIRQLGIITDGLIVRNQLPKADAIIVIGEANQLARERFAGNETQIVTYKRVPVTHEIDLNDFHGVVFPSSLAVQDLFAGISDEAKKQLVTMPCLAMGRHVLKQCQQYGMKKVQLTSAEPKEIITKLKGVLDDESNSVIDR